MHVSSQVALRNRTSRPHAVALQDFSPRIHVTASDFASITQNGDLCDETGQLGPNEFEAVMRKQARKRIAKLSHFALL